MEKRELFFKKLNTVLCFALPVIAIIISSYCFIHSHVYNGTLVLLTIPMLIIPNLFYGIFKATPVNSLNFLVYLFITLAYTIGVALSGYNNIPLFDKLAHTLSGVLFTFIGLVLLTILKPEQNISKRDFPLLSIFSVSFSLAVAAVWEIIEYTINYIAHNDPQKVARTGVNDTMLDIIVCAAGSLLFLIPMYLYFYKHKKSFMMGIYTTFVDNERKKDRKHK